MLEIASGAPIGLRVLRRRPIWTVVYYCRGGRYLLELLQGHVLALEIEDFLEELDLNFVQDLASRLSVEVVSAAKLPVEDGNIFQESQRSFSKLAVTESCALLCRCGRARYEHAFRLHIVLESDLHLL